VKIIEITYQQSQQNYIGLEIVELSENELIYYNMTEIVSYKNTIDNGITAAKIVNKLCDFIDNGIYYDPNNTIVFDHDKQAEKEYEKIYGMTKNDINNHFKDEMIINIENSSLSDENKEEKLKNEIEIFESEVYNTFNYFNNHEY